MLSQLSRRLHVLTFGIPWLKNYFKILKICKRTRNVLTFCIIDMNINRLPIDHRYRKSLNRLLKVCYVPTTSAVLIAFFSSFLLQPLTVLMKQTRLPVFAIKQSIYLDVCSRPTNSKQLELSADVSCNFQVSRQNIKISIVIYFTCYNLKFPN